MKRAVRSLALGCGLVIIAASASTSAKEAVAKPASLQAEVLQEWSDRKESVMRLLEHMPAEKYNFKPTMPSSRDEDHGGAVEDFGTRALYIAQVNVRFLALLGAKVKSPVLNDTMTSKQASMKAVADSFDYGIAILKEQTDQTMLQTLEASFLGISSRSRVFRYLDGHTHQIDGQLALYMRLSGVDLPAVLDAG